MKYECLLNVKVGDVVHKPGDVIDLTDEQARYCLQQRAVVPVADPTPAPQSTQPKVGQPAQPKAAAPTPPLAQPAQPAQTQQQSADQIQQANAK
jgi:hypothetical protein